MIKKKRLPLTKESINIVKKHLFDLGRNITDKANIHGLRGEAYIKNTLTGEVIFKKNKIILPGSMLVASKLFDIDLPFTTPSYNTALSLDQSTTSIADTSDKEKVYLFAIGTDGSTQTGTIADVDYSKWISPDSLVPFRMVLPNSDLSEENRSLYYGRKTRDDYILYYFKAFDQEPEIVIEYEDGTPVDSGVYTSSNTTNIKVYVELRFTVTKQDAREYFMNTTGIADAKISSISLLTANPVTGTDGYVYYQNIRPLTKLHISEEKLDDLDKGLDITYDIIL